MIKFYQGKRIDKIQVGDKPAFPKPQWVVIFKDGSVTTFSISRRVADQYHGSEG